MLLYVLFLYKKHTKIGQKCVQNTVKRTFEKPSIDYNDFIMSNTTICNDLQPICKIQMGKLEFYCLIIMKNLTFDFKRCFLSFFNFMLFKFQNAISQEPCVR